MECCIREIRNWMRHDKLMLNADKTEFIIIGTCQQLAKINFEHITVGCNNITSSTSVRNLGAWFDERLSMTTHITKLCCAAFYHLHNIRRIRKYSSQDAAETLIHSFITSRVDYFNGLLHGLSAYQLQKLQKMQNAAARLIFMERKYCHITSLKKLHWLPIKYRIQFKILLITFKAIHGLAPSYIVDLICVKPLDTRYSLRSTKGLLLEHPKCKTYVTLGDRAFKAAVPTLWNEVPIHIRNSKSLSSCKNLLKTHLFKLSFLD